MPSNIFVTDLLSLGTSVSKIRRFSSSDFFYFKSLNINMKGKNYE